MFARTAPPLPTAPHRPDATETVSGFAVSLLFWFSLLLAAALFAVVALSPKLLARSTLSDQYHLGQMKLVSLERHNEQLQRVVDAIRNDREFAAELTRIEFDAVRPDEEIIPVPSELKLETRGIETPRAQPVLPAAWYRPLLVVFAQNASLRSSLLGAAALLIVISFTWLLPASAHPVAGRAGAGHTVWQALRSRYVRSA